MAIVVVGGHAKNVGKTSVVASLIARLPERNWTAFKLTSDHGSGSLHGETGRREEQDEPLVAVSTELDLDAATDSARFLAAGAKRSLWVRTRAGRLEEAMPRIHREIAGAENAIFESNSVLKFLRPDLYLVVLDHATADFKDSALQFLDRADAVLLRASSRDVTPQWKGVSPHLIAGKPQFLVEPPAFLAEDLVAFVKRKLAAQ